MGSKRKARGGATKEGKSKKAKAAIKQERRIIFNPVKGPLPNEILVQILLKLDPLSQHAFGLANHHFRQVFLDKYDSLYGHPYGYKLTHYGVRFLPIKMSSRHNEPGKLPFKFRNMMRSWIPSTYTWDPDSQKYLGSQLKERALEDGLIQAESEQQDLYHEVDGRFEDYKEQTRLYKEFKQSNKKAWQQARMEHMDDLRQQHLAKKGWDEDEDYEDSTDYDSEGSRYSANGTPHTRLADPYYQSRKVPEDFVGRDLEPVDKPDPWKDFEDTDDDYLVSGSDI